MIIMQLNKENIIFFLKLRLFIHQKKKQLSYYSYYNDYYLSHSQLGKCFHHLLSYRNQQIRKKKNYHNYKN
jgi:hypothetical protein